jgi:hypothetical protein
MVTFSMTHPEFLSKCQAPGSPINQFQVLVGAGSRDQLPEDLPSASFPVPSVGVISLV